MKSSWYKDKDYADRERWICIYPAYINSKKSVSEGRRIPKPKAIENPTAQEMVEALSTTGLNALLENKLYSRERSKEVSYRGRIRVQLKNSDGTLMNPEFPTRESLMLHISSSIPKLKSRTQKTAEHHGRAETSKKKGKGRK